MYTFAKRSKALKFLFELVSQTKRLAKQHPALLIEHHTVQLHLTSNGQQASCAHAQQMYFKWNSKLSPCKGPVSLQGLWKGISVVREFQNSSYKFFISLGEFRRLRNSSIPKCPKSSISNSSQHRRFLELRNSNTGETPASPTAIANKGPTCIFWILWLMQSQVSRDRQQHNCKWLL